jgi:hypothetical protein
MQYKRAKNWFQRQNKGRKKVLSLNEKKKTRIKVIHMGDEFGLLLKFTKKI